MFASPAYAQATGAATESGGLAMIMQFAPLLFIFVIFYFLLIRPQQRKMKEHRQTVEALKKNDIVVTAGGVIGKVVAVQDHEVEVEIAPTVKVKVVKATITEVRTTGSGKPAND